MRLISNENRQISNEEEQQSWKVIESVCIECMRNDDALVLEEEQQQQQWGKRREKKLSKKMNEEQ